MTPQDLAAKLPEFQAAFDDERKKPRIRTVTMLAVGDTEYHERYVVPAAQTLAEAMAGCKRLEPLTAAVRSQLSHPGYGYDGDVLVITAKGWLE